MSVLGKIVSAIFGHANAAPAPAPSAPATPVAPWLFSTVCSLPHAKGVVYAGRRARRPRQCRGDPYETRGEQQREARLAKVNRRPDETSQSRLEPYGAKGACRGASFYRRQERFRDHERLAAQTSDAEAAENGGKVPDELRK